MMNQKIIDILFVLILISAPFKFANHIFSLPAFITFPFSHDLIIWPLLVGLFYTLYCQCKYGNIFYNWSAFKKYILAYLIVLFISLMIGMINYPYWDMVFNGQALNNHKFAMAIDILNKVGIHAEGNDILPIWLFVKSIKNIVLSVLYTFGGAYMIFCWYHDRVNRALHLLKNVTVGFLVAIAAYGLIEICYQNGQLWAQNFLLFMWPLLHSNLENTFYPVLYGARIRSLFLEASYFSIYMAFAFPILWWKFIESSKKGRIAYGILYAVLACEIFLAQSRTGTALFLGELALFVIVTIFKRDRKLFIYAVALVAGACIAFGGTIYFMQNYQVPAYLGDTRPLADRKMELISKGLGPRNKEDHNISTESYIDDSLLSLAGGEAAEKREGSNHVRYGVTLANVNIGLEHPILGVGPGLDTAYLYDVFKSDQNPELKNRFVKQLEAKGLLEIGSPFMCEYSAQFMQSGILGLLFYIAPIGFVLFQLILKLMLQNWGESNCLSLLFIIMSDIGISLTGFGNTLNITYCFWLMLGLSYVVLFNTDSNK